jgi:hypothetical protein
MNSTKNTNSNTRIYKTKDGYEIVKYSREIYAIIGKSVKFIGMAGSGYVPSGKLVKGMPNEIKQTFFNIQRK